MNVELYDGTVRCMDCMDASTYADETTKPCLYCGKKGRKPYGPGENHMTRAIAREMGKRR